MKTKILLVDDEADLEFLFRQRFRRQIQSNEYEFVFVRDGLEALGALRQQSDIDLILSDINMPGMDGLTLLSHLPEVNAFVRTVMVTAYGDMDNIRTAMNRGAFDFITKPINFKDLEVTIEKTRQYVSQLRETAELKAVDEMKTRFFANMTHELRTPLSMIIAPVDKLLENADLPVPYQQQLLMVRRNARQLLRLINQLLDINKLEAQQMTVVDELGDLPSFIEQIIDLFRPSADLKNITLTYQTDMPAGNYTFDASKWEKILYNLLSNAIKFTDGGEVSVHLHQQPTAAKLRVSDTGMGIPADKLPHIFNRFYQVDSSRIRAYEGTGIGLALVKELTSRLGGTITVQSQESHPEGLPGTHFVVELPLQPMTITDENFLPLPILVTATDFPSPVTATTPSELVLSQDTPLILVVEDNAELREFIVSELGATYRIRAAVNGHEGLILARQELPDVVISDVMMPRMDGFTLTEQLKSDPTTDHIAVILLTATLEDESRMQGFRHGADEYLTKPFHMAELSLRLRNLFTRQQKLRSQYRQQFAQPDTSSPLESVQDHFLRRLYKLIEQRLDDSSMSVEWLAEQLAMSRKTLYLKVNSLTQLSPNELIRQYRLRKAIDLLRLGHSASETAYMVGFETPSYFTKVFREFYKQTPTEYTKR